MSKSYDFNEHKHRYAIWTAARAVQRSFTTTQNIAAVLNQTPLREFSESQDDCTQDQFDIEHCGWCNQIIEAFDRMNIDLECSYGRAAKMIAIYLKTSVVLPSQGMGNKASIIHPPIDRILLRNTGALKELNKNNWTQFTGDDYWYLVGWIRYKNLEFNWKLEKHWSPE